MQAVFFVLFFITIALVSYMTIGYWLYRYTVGKMLKVEDKGLRAKLLSIPTPKSYSLYSIMSYNASAMQLIELHRKGVLEACIGELVFDGVMSNLKALKFDIRDYNPHDLILKAVLIEGGRIAPIALSGDVANIVLKAVNTTLYETPHKNNATEQRVALIQYCSKNLNQ